MSNLSEQIMRAGRAQATTSPVRKAERDAAEGKLKATLTTEASFRVPENSDVPNWPVIRAEREALETRLRARRARLTSLTTNLDKERWCAVADIVDAIRWQSGSNPGTLSLGNGVVQRTPQSLTDYVFDGDKKGPKISELIGIVKRAVKDEIVDVYTWIKDNHGLNDLYRYKIAKRQTNPRARGSGKQAPAACTVPPVGDFIAEAPSASALNGDERATPVTERQYSLTLGDGVVEQSVMIPSGSDAAAITKAVTGLMRTLALADHAVMIVGQFFIAGDEEDDGQWFDCPVDAACATNWEVRQYDERWGWEPYRDYPSLNEAVAAADSLRAELAAAIEPSAEADHTKQSEPVARGDEPQPPTADGRAHDDEPKQGAAARMAQSPPSERGRSASRPPPNHQPVGSSGHAGGRRLTCALGPIGCVHHKMCRQQAHCTEAKSAAD